MTYMTPRYSFITPTLVRPTLSRLCRSIDSQVETEWEHLVIADCTMEDYLRHLPFLTTLEHPNRYFFCCEHHHANGGNSCRNKFQSAARGEYLFFIDDDDFLADNEVLNTLNVVEAPWAIFPADHYGQYFLHVPPGMCRTGTGMFIFKRGLATWPDTDQYESDGVLIEQLIQKYPYEVVSGRSLVIQPKQNRGASAV